MKLAVLKPDHLGDLILSSAAIRSLADAHPGLTLFVASRNLDLARWLFPQVELRPFDMPHLARGQAPTEYEPDLSQFEAVAILRRDNVLTPRWAQLRTRAYAMFQEEDDVHQTLLDYGVAREFAPAYDIDASYFGERRPLIAEKQGRAVRAVGLSIGSGFYSNIWPLTRWIALARALQQHGCAPYVISGPAEAAMAAVLRREARLGPERAISGGDDYAGFAAAVGELDLVVASDGGTAHLCSTAAPVLSIFGSSPYRRYAPYGAWNRTLNQGLSCSPCIQYHSRRVNGCLSVECMTAITAKDVVSALELRPAPQLPAAMAPVRDGLMLLRGVSHARQGQELALREKEHLAWQG